MRPVIRPTNLVIPLINRNGQRVLSGVVVVVKKSATIALVHLRLRVNNPEIAGSMGIVRIEENRGSK